MVKSTLSVRDASEIVNLAERYAAMSQALVYGELAVRSAARDGDEALIAVAEIVHNEAQDRYSQASLELVAFLGSLLPTNIDPDDLVAGLAAFGSK